MAHTDAERRTRERARRVYGALFTQATRILQAHDPVGLVHGESPGDEYEAEVAAVLPLLVGARDADDVHRLLHLELLRWSPPAVVGDAERLGAVATELWDAYQLQLAIDPVVMAAPAWAAGGLDLHVARVLHESTPTERRPAWAAGVLRTGCDHLVAPTAVTGVVDLADEPRRWREARAAHVELRDLALALEHRGASRRERGLVYLADTVAKIVHNASGVAPPFDDDACWRLGPRLREVMSAFADRAFAEEAERALFTVAAPRRSGGPRATASRPGALVR